MSRSSASVGKASVGKASVGKPLPRVDPQARVALPTRVYAAVLGTPIGRWNSINVAPRVDPLLLRTTGGRIGMGLMLPSALLTTTGAKSGLPRTSTVLYFHDGDDVVLVASNFGRDAHPSWYYNLRAHPRVRIGKDGDGAEWLAAEVTAADERRRLWDSADRVYPGYADYRLRSAQVGRTIPLIRLRPA